MPTASDLYKLEASARSFDTIAVYNHTDEDFSMWTDKAGPERQRTIIPNVKKDVGFGKGRAHMRRHIAKRISTELLLKIIHNISDSEWKTRKEDLRMLSRNERLEIARVEQIRSNDPYYLYQYTYHPATKMLHKELTGEETIQDLIDEERAKRKEVGVDIPVKTLIWLGIIKKFEGYKLQDDVDEFRLTDTKSPFSYDI